MNRYDQFNATLTTVTAVMLVAWVIFQLIEIAYELQLTAAFFSVSTAWFAWMTAIKGE